MALCRITSVKKADGTIRDIAQVFYEGDPMEPVVLEPGEKVIETVQASTMLAKLMDGIVDPLPEELKAELLAIREVYRRGEFVDITDKIDNIM